MVRPAVLLAIAACGGSAASSRGSSAPTPARPEAMPVAATRSHAPRLETRPSVRLAAVLPAASPWPWPLTEAPSLQPHWDPAMAHDACEPAWAQRHANDVDAKAYVAAWCRLRASDRGAVDELGRLAHTARAELAKPARLDAINLIADELDAAHAVAWLRELSLDGPDALDLLAATYHSLGSHVDASSVEAIIASRDRAPKDRAECERLVGQGVLDDDGLRIRLEVVARDGKSSCVERLAPLVCAMQASCDAATMPDPDLVAAIRLYRAWDETEFDLRRVAFVAERYVRFAWLGDVAIAALHDLVVLSGCRSDELSIVRGLAARLFENAAHDPQLDDELEALSMISSEQCAERLAASGNVGERASVLER